MKVLIVARPDLFLVPGGDTVQIRETAAALKELKVETDIVISDGVDYKKYDLIHFFNIIDPEDILGHVLRSRLPYVISTVYVDYREYDRLHRKDAVGTLSRIFPRDTVEYLKTLAKFVLRKEKISTRRFFIKGHKGSIQYLLHHTAMLLPNSENEYRRLKKDYATDQKYAVVPNAVNPELFVQKKVEERSIVLCVGRIEGRKNQLNVIRALKGTNYKVVFIGASSQNQSEYVAQCKSEAGPNMQFIDHIPQRELLAYYNMAKVHVLASWFETTGLSNLEAGAMGCSLVVGDRGDVRDYFGDMVSYCEPGDIDSIRKAVDKAWNKKETGLLQKHIFNNFTWSVAANVTHSAYKQVLETGA